MKKGGVILDDFAANQTRLRDRGLWWRVLKNVRAGIMPPAGKPQPSRTRGSFSKTGSSIESFGIDPKNPDPGRVTVRRLNRIEYRNTIRDLMGVDYDTAAEFPPDDTGHGFDNIGDVLTLSPLLLEKYIAAASRSSSGTVPTTRRTVAEHNASPAGSSTARVRPQATGESATGPLSLSYYEPAAVSTTFRVEHAGRYQLVLDLTANERFVDGVFDYNKCRLIFKVDGENCPSRNSAGRTAGPITRCSTRLAGRRASAHPRAQAADAGGKTSSLAGDPDQFGHRARPAGRAYWVRPTDYARFFPTDVPAGAVDRQHYARELLGRFATRAFRRPVEETVDRLVAFATGGLRAGTDRRSRRASPRP